MQRSRMSGRPWPTAIDLFAGAGSATAALKAAHFRFLAAVDNDPSACATYRLNHPTVRIRDRNAPVTRTAPPLRSSYGRIAALPLGSHG